MHCVLINKCMAPCELKVYNGRVVNFGCLIASNVHKSPWCQVDLGPISKHTPSWTETHGEKLNVDTEHMISPIVTFLRSLTHMSWVYFVFK